MSQVKCQPKPYLDSEHYRQMLVRDGERRFQEWHNAFLEHQKAFRAATQEGVGQTSSARSRICEASRRKAFLPENSQR